MTVSIEIDPKTEAQLNNMARQAGIDMPALIVKLVKQTIPTGPLLGDFDGLTFAEKFGDLIGAAETGPTDMARHPEKYMKGFGVTKNRRTIKP